MKKQTKSISASVRARLLNLSRTHDEDFQMVLTRYVIERFLYRLSLSEHSGKFIVKGAVLFSLWDTSLSRRWSPGGPRAKKLQKMTGGDYLC